MYHLYEVMDVVETTIYHETTDRDQHASSTQIMTIEDCIDKWLAAIDLPNFLKHHPWILENAGSTSCHNNSCKDDAGPSHIRHAAVAGFSVFQLTIECSKTDDREFYDADDAVSQTDADGPARIKEIAKDSSEDVPRRRAYAVLSSLVAAGAFLVISMLAYSTYFNVTENNKKMVCEC